MVVYRIFYGLNDEYAEVQWSMKLRWCGLVNGVIMYEKVW